MRSSAAAVFLAALLSGGTAAAGEPFGPEATSIERRARVRITTAVPLEAAQRWAEASSSAPLTLSILPARRGVQVTCSVAF